MDSERECLTETDARSLHVAGQRAEQSFLIDAFKVTGCVTFFFVYAEKWLKVYGEIVYSDGKDNFNMQ